MRPQQVRGQGRTVCRSCRARPWRDHAASGRYATIRACAAASTCSFWAGLWGWSRGHSDNRGCCSLRAPRSWPLHPQPALPRDLAVLPLLSMLEHEGAQVLALVDTQGCRDQRRGDVLFPSPPGEGGAQRRMRERSRTMAAAASRSIRPSSAFGTFSRKEKGTEMAREAEQALRGLNACVGARTARRARRSARCTGRFRSGRAGVPEAPTRRRRRHGRSTPG